MSPNRSKTTILLSLRTVLPDSRSRITKNVASSRRSVMVNPEHFSPKVFITSTRCGCDCWCDQGLGLSSTNTRLGRVGATRVFCEAGAGAAVGCAGGNGTSADSSITGSLTVLLMTRMMSSEIPLLASSARPPAVTSNFEELVRINWTMNPSENLAFTSVTTSRFVRVLRGAAALSAARSGRDQPSYGFFPTPHIGRNCFDRPAQPPDSGPVEWIRGGTPSSGTTGENKTGARCR